MNYNSQESIIPGQITELRGIYYRAQSVMPGTPCRMQCDCRMPEYAVNKTNCSGFCYRWSNCGKIVFRRIDCLPEGENIIVETKFAKDCRLSGSIGLKENL